jgi:hypothetical protein
MKLGDVLAAMRNGAVLHLSFADGPRWQLNDGVTVVTVSCTAVQAAIRRGEIVGAGDSLFADIPSQTWRCSSEKGPTP